MLRLLAIVTVLLLGMTACSDGTDGEDADDTAEGTTATDDADADADAEADPDVDADAEDAATEDDGTDGGDASGEPITIGVLTSFTGPFTPWGLQTRAGMQLAVDEINADGGVDGRMIELVEADDQNNPDEGVTALERMVEQEGVVAVGGVISSDVALATSRTAEELEVPLFMVKAGAAGVLTTDSRYTFRTCLPAAPMTAEPLAQYIQSEGLSRIGVIIADYAWGQSVRESIEEVIGGLEGVEVQVEVAPVPETDFTTYLRALEGFEPDLIAATGHPPGAGPITLQAADLGFDVPVTGPYAPLATVFEAVGDVAYDSYADYGCADYSSDDYQALARRFAESSEFGFMEDDAVAGYGIVTMVAEAVAEVGDDPVAVAEYLHGNEFDLPGYSHTMAWTEFGELSQSRPALVIIREMSPPEGINEGAPWYPEVVFIPEPLEPYVPEG
ncbi:MAG TPA: ABC transporter substrate-binding protein [Euzebya sp.]|nr:ABC transporter substrate-binding protein [Euzebya sp.]